MYVTGLFRPCVVNVGRRAMSSAAAGEFRECEYVYGVRVGRNSHSSPELDSSQAHSTRPS